MNKEAILKLLQRCHRQWHTPDLHSFKARIKDGVVFVECDLDHVQIDAFIYDGAKDVRHSWRTGTALSDAVEILATLGIDMATVET